MIGRGRLLLRQDGSHGLCSAVGVDKRLDPREVVQHHQVRSIEVPHLLLPVQQHLQVGRGGARGLDHGTLPPLERSAHHAHLHADAQRMRVTPLVLHSAVAPARRALRRRRLHRVVPHLLVHHQRHGAQAQPLRARLDLLRVSVARSTHVDGRVHVVLAVPPHAAQHRLPEVLDLDVLVRVAVDVALLRKGVHHALEILIVALRLRLCAERNHGLSPGNAVAVDERRLRSIRRFGLSLALVQRDHEIGLGLGRVVGVVDVFQNSNAGFIFGVRTLCS